MLAILVVSCNIMKSQSFVLLCIDEFPSRNLSMQKYVVLHCGSMGIIQFFHARERLLIEVVQHPVAIVWKP